MKGPTKGAATPSSCGAAQLVGFFDLLGTKSLVKSGRFSRDHVLDFSAPAGLVVDRHREWRAAAFSDCIVLSCVEHDSAAFVDEVGYMFANWWADGMLVRAGIAHGRVSWADEPSIDRAIFALPNFTFARVYGEALVDAYELEGASGPGSICHLSEGAASLLQAAAPGSVIESIGPMLNWMEADDIEKWLNWHRSTLEGEVAKEARRHLLATVRFLKLARGQANPSPKSRASSRRRSLPR